MEKLNGASRLEGDELLTWSALATVLEWLPAMLDVQLRRDADVTHSEYGILSALLHATDHTLRMSVLAGYANSSLTRLSRAVTRLERRQWVRRATDPDDGRFTLAILTDLGQVKVEQAAPGHVAIVRRLVLEPLTKAQQRQLLDITHGSWPLLALVSRGDRRPTRHVPSEPCLREGVVRTGRVDAGR